MSELETVKDHMLANLDFVRELADKHLKDPVDLRNKISELRDEIHGIDEEEMR